MSSFCSCMDDDYDFEKGDYERWWECGIKCAPKPGDVCCECGAALPTDRKREAAVHYEAYQPENEPPYPDEGELSPAEFDAREREYDAWRSAHGWDDESERYERETGIDFRCDRCEGEVEILAQFDVCVSTPGDLPGAHEEHYWQAHRRRIRWRPGPDGVWHPQPWRLIDYARHYRKRAYWRIRREWQYEFRYRLRKTFVWPVEFAIAHAVHRDRFRRYRWEAQMRRIEQ